MLPNLADLQKKCAEMGLTVVTQGKRPAKEDCVSVLRAHYLKADYPNGMPFEELTPMLCFAEWNLKDSEKENMWSEQGSAWVAQRKLNGCRVILHFVKGVGVFAHSRTISVKTYRSQELTESLLFRDMIPNFTATVDCEALIEKPVDTRPYTGGKGEVTKSSLHSTTAVLHLAPESGRRLQVDQIAPLMFQVFDITNWEGTDLKKKSLASRLIYLSKFKDQLLSCVENVYFQFPEVVTSGKRAFFKKVVAEGGEGVVMKNLNSPYEDSSSRRRDAWVKVKKRIEFDCFVSGFKPGEPDSGWASLVGALEFSINTDKGPWVLGYCSNITMEERLEMSTLTLKGPVLKQEYYGRVAQISGQDITARSYRLSHCTLDRWRVGVDGKTAAECFVGMESLKEAASWVA